MPSLSVIDELKLELSVIAAETKVLFEKLEHASAQYERDAILGESVHLAERLNDIAREARTHVQALDGTARAGRMPFF